MPHYTVPVVYFRYQKENHMKYVIWLLVFLLVVPFMVYDTGSAPMTNGVASREAFGMGQYGFDLTVGDHVYFIQVSGVGVFAISEGISVGDAVSVPTARLDRCATVVSASDIQILKESK